MLSDDSNTRRLKYCIHCYRYVSVGIVWDLLIFLESVLQLIDSQILILRDFLASLQPLPSKAFSANPILEEDMRQLADVQCDIVHTIRRVVNVVRNCHEWFILGLPHGWASKAMKQAPKEEEGKTGG
jgi:hypothetical protein